MKKVYKCPSPVLNTVTAQVSASVQLGFSAGGNLSASEAKKYNLGVTGSATANASASFSSVMTIPGWTAKGIRAYVKWTEHKYKGYRVYKYSLNGILYDASGWEYATDKSLRSTGVKYWEVTNTSHNVNAVTPNPPTGWVE